MGLFLRGGEDFVYSALHVKISLGNVVELAVEDHFEPADGFLDRNVPAGRPREDLGDGERLRKEALDLPGAVDRDLILGRELVEAKDRDNVLEVLVALEHAL